MAVKKTNEKVVDLETEDLKAQIRAELLAEIEAEKEQAIAAIEEKLAKTEAEMESQIRAEEKTAEQQLDAMPKVMLEIPEDPNNPDDVVPIGFNGIIYAVPRGIPFEVPKAIYDIWKDSHLRTQEVNKRVRDSVKKEVNIM